MSSAIPPQTLQTAVDVLKQSREVLYEQQQQYQQCHQDQTTMPVRNSIDRGRSPGQYEMQSDPNISMYNTKTQNAHHNRQQYPQQYSQFGDNLLQQQTTPHYEQVQQQQQQQKQQQQPHQPHQQPHQQQHQ